MTRRAVARCLAVFSRALPLAFIAYGAALLYVYRARMSDIRASRETMPYVVHKEMKYVLQWTRRFSAPFDFMGEGNSAFVKNRCEHTNCFVTDDRSYFADLTRFDAVAFNGRDVADAWTFRRPPSRSPAQKYIFGAMESADNFPVCDEALDGFFNWTWTYRLDSDFRWGYVTVYDSAGVAVGPAVGMRWPERMAPAGAALRARLARKRRAAAWFVSDCGARSGRDTFVRALRSALAPRGLDVDVFGACGDLACPRSDPAACFRRVREDYYFYLAFENSFSEDYVTEKLLIALNNYAVPVVYGFADYSRFLPEGSYLNALELGPERLARAMSEIIANRSRYYDYFRWRNHFTYKETSSTADICKLCEVLNDEEMVKKVTVWTNFREWWNGARYRDHCS